MAAIFFGLLLQLSTLACAVTSITVDFRVTPSYVDPATAKIVRLQCRVTDYNHLTNLTSLRILKNDQSDWRALAELIDLDPGTVHLEDEDVSSGAGSLRRYGDLLGHLTLTWEKVSLATLGQYKCHAVRYIPENRVSTEVSTLSIGSNLDSLALLRVMQSEKDEVTEKLKQLAGRANQAEEAFITDAEADISSIREQLALLDAELSDALAAQDSKLEQLKEHFQGVLESSRREQSARLEEISSELEGALKRGFLTLWPQGSYGLAMAESGCPSSAGVAWETGFRKHHTESTDRNDDHVSKGSHLKQPVMSREASYNFITQSFCVKTDVTPVGPAWPQGSYCVNKRGPCPQDFQEGSILWDDENDEPRSTLEGAAVDGEFTSTGSRLRYCCRGDGKPERAVELPRVVPFYLYRYGGRCQQVAGMTVTEETVTFDTENSDNSDEAVGSHPDAELNNVVLHLCYYKNREKPSLVIEN